jgi:flagellar hook-associated protein 1 FlgK
MSISRIFDISRRSLGVYQRALDVTAHNIANASNPNYSRQRVLVSSETPEVTAGFIWGTGAKLDNIIRARNQMNDSQIRTNNYQFSNSSKQSQLLGQIEETFSEPSELGLSNLMNSFFGTWTELSVSPNSVPLRSNVIHAAEKLASKVKSIHENLEVIKNDTLSEFKENVSSLNRILSEVQSLNQQIYESSVAGYSPNDLLDKRDAAIDELSNLTNITVSTDTDNMVSISIGGVFAVNRNHASQFKITTTNGKLGLATTDGDLNVKITSGELNAQSEIYSNKIPEYLSKLDEVVQQLFDSVNTAHRAGHTLTDPPQTNINFFESFTDGVLTINNDIINNPNLIAASADGTAGNGETALHISELMNQNILNGSKLGDIYSNLISQIGNETLASSQSAESSLLILEQLDMQRSSYSGVSIDEEMTNVIKFQRSYDASAKLIKVADEMLETLINMV